MAIYHLTAKTVSRGNGSAAAKSDYIERENRYKKDHDELAYKASGNMPSWAQDMPRKYWDSADTYERENGRLFKQVEFALPKELTTEEQIQLATDFAEKIASTKDGKLPYSFAIHKGHGKGNPHCHMMLSERVNDGNSRTPETWFRRAGKWEKAGAKKTLELRPKDWLLSVRREWSHEANKALEKAGHQVRIDHRTLAAQGIDREPTQHRGPALCAMLAKGVTPRQREGEQEASREHTKILRQQLAEAPQRAVSSPSLVERAGAGLGSLYGAVERREETPASVRPEAARPTPQKGAEAPQRAVSSPSLVELFKRYVYAVQAEKVRITCTEHLNFERNYSFTVTQKGISFFDRRRIENSINHGHDIYYTPLSENRHHILIDDMSVQSVNRLRAEGFQPAVILSSSPGKFQCILTIPKLGTDFDSQVGERIAGLLNRRYGDKDFSGGIHPHRAPGFENRNRRGDDYPEVRLIAATRVECPKALELSQLFNSRLEEADREARERAAAKEQERAQAAQREAQHENREKDTPAAPKPSPPAPRTRMR